MDMKTKYPLLSAENIPAYGVVMGFWIFFSLISAFIMHHVSDSAIGWGAALILGFASVMTGMGIMFGASAVNLKKLRPGFERLAAGEKDPRIPRVWCPVLTMATRAAVELSEKIIDKKDSQ